MALAAGARLGPYEILSQLGAGGMGEVYLARDTRLGREVAIKVLPPHLADTPEARARFDREARAISALNHPHVCALYDVGHENGVDFLVLEKIDGETLAARLARGPLPIDQVLRLGIQIADALDRAHRSGLVHRDLKPGNVMLAKSGAKLMDFGLARVAGLASAVSDSSIAPTITPSQAQPVTARGTIVGTFQYMPPEQLEGREADVRSDLWALGCVLYEMATGKRAFEGKSQASLISAIMSSEPPRMSDLVPLTPAALDRLVRACLAKDPDERIQSAHDAKLQLRWIADGGDATGAPPRPRTGWRERAIWVGVAAGLTVLGVVATLALHRPVVDREPVKFLVGIPQGQISIFAPRLSPDGRSIVLTSDDSTGNWCLWLRSMGALESRPLPGTDKAYAAMWSPDGHNIAFVSGGKLSRVPVTGGPAVTIAEVGGSRGDGSWSRSGVIILASGRNDSMITVPVAGGAASPASRLDRVNGEFEHDSPRFLPDGKHFLFVALRQGHGQVTGVLKLGRLGTLEAEELGPCNSDVEIAPPNRVFYVNGTTLVTQTVDVFRGALTGDRVPLAEGLPVQVPALFTVGGGSLAVLNPSGTVGELLWMDRAGRVTSRVGEPNRYREIALSPEARRVAVAIEDPAVGADDLWVRDLDRDVSTRLTFDRTQETGPVWSVDGSRLFYSSDRQGGNYIIYSTSPSGAGPEDTISVGMSGNEGPSDVTPDGKWLIIMASKGGGETTNDWDILIRDIDGKQPPRPFCVTSNFEFAPTISPDGRWLAYCSDETGRPEIYVRSFPDGARKWRVSSGGGSACAWSRKGRELIYQNPTDDLMAVPVASGPDFQPGKPVKLFHASLCQFGWTVRRWAVTADGERFLINQRVRNTLPGITVTRNWESTVARR